MLLNQKFKNKKRVSDGDQMYLYFPKLLKGNIVIVSNQIWTQLIPYLASIPGKNKWFWENLLSFTKNYKED